MTQFISASSARSRTLRLVLCLRSSPQVRLAYQSCPVSSPRRDTFCILVREPKTRRTRPGKFRPSPCDSFQSPSRPPSRISCAPATAENALHRPSNGPRPVGTELAEEVSWKSIKFHSIPPKILSIASSSPAGDFPPICHRGLVSALMCFFRLSLPVCVCVFCFVYLCKAVVLKHLVHFQLQRFGASVRCVV